MYPAKVQTRSSKSLSDKVKNPSANAEATGDAVQSLGQEEPMEEEIATCSNILAWEISWTEELGKVQSVGSQRVRHD